MTCTPGDLTLGREIPVAQLASIPPQKTSHRKQVIILLAISVFVLLAILVWRMPLPLAVMSTLYGAAYAVWPILWIVFAALWLYNLSVDMGNFDLLRRWMAERASSTSPTETPQCAIFVCTPCFFSRYAVSPA